ncbi:MAG: methylated-DNA--[protein]-cysteine S-methyltransferase [Bryobacter sp.]|nr:methylated-DNA--[protein]-cysteine S-methyltransferase [Bryobacter sp.]
MKERDVVKELAEYLRGRAAEAVTLEEMSRRTGYSAFYLQKRFKAEMGVTPKQFHAQCRREVLKRELREGSSVTGALFEAGYGSTSRVYENAREALGMTPGEYGKAGAGVEISFVVRPTRLGQLLLAATERGLCAVRLGEQARALCRELQEEFPGAKLTEAGPPYSAALEQWWAAIEEYLAGKKMPRDLPLDVQATAFQASVWQFLQSIPAGETRTYAEVAEGIGRPSAIRAVARACAANPLALVVPCHRVIRADGKLGGYRWGMGRKRQLLEAEREAAGY